MRHERLAPNGALRPCLLVAPALLLAANFGISSLREAAAPKSPSTTLAVSRSHPGDQPPADAQTRRVPRPGAAAHAPERATPRLARVTDVADSSPRRQEAFDDEAATQAESLEIRLIADAPTLPQVIAPPPPPEPTPPPPEARSFPALPVDSIWRSLAMCESGGNWQSDDGDGYYGGLQFDLPSWQEVGGDGYPSEHAPDVQIEMAERLQARQGWAAWPNCSRVLGLL